MIEWNGLVELDREYLSTATKQLEEYLDSKALF